MSVHRQGVAVSDRSCVCDRAVVPTVPLSRLQRCPFSWWMTVVVDQVSHRVIGFAVLEKMPTSIDAGRLLDRATTRAEPAVVLHLPPRLVPPTHRARARQTGSPEGRWIRTPHPRAHAVQQDAPKPSAQGVRFVTSGRAVGTLVVTEYVTKTVRIGGAVRTSDAGVTKRRPAHEESDVS